MARWLITQRLERNIHGDVVDVLERNYIDYLGAFLPRLVSLSNHPSTNASDFDYDGLVLTGGGDLPNRFLGGERLNAEDNALAEEKFELQSRFLAHALQAGKPVLAICYGMMLVNAHFGGTLTWNAHGGAEDRRPGTTHTVTVADSNAVGLERDRASVNTYHHQGIRRDGLADGLEGLAFDTDYDLVEAAFHRQARILCLLWHPERPSPDPDFNETLIRKWLSC